ncbi:MAG: AIM24 family protein [Cyanobacteria bacterium P01_G01_bin.38]
MTATPSPKRTDVAKPASKLAIIGTAANQGFKVDILAYRTLAGSNDPGTAQSVYYANQTGLRLKQIRVTLDQSEAIAEAGTLHYMRGHLELDNPVGGVGGLGKAMLKKMLTTETAFMPRYRGTGEIYLEPSFGDFMVYQLHNETLVADKGLFYCGEGTVKTGIAAQKNVSSALFGGEGFFQTKIQGSGICVFELPVPVDEVRCIQLNNETLKVDGNFALMRSGQIDFSVERSSKGIMGSLSSGEGLLQTFRGTGRVWLAPTQSVYDRMRFGGIGSLSSAQRSSNTST